MPRVYKPKPGARPYAAYVPRDLQRAIEKHKFAGWSLNKCAKVFNLNRQTLKNKTGKGKGKAPKQVPLAASDSETDEEEVLDERAVERMIGEDDRIAEDEADLEMLECTHEDSDEDP